MKLLNKFCFLLILVVLQTSFLIAEEAKPGVYFTNLKDGQVITSPYKVTFGVTGMTVAQAGEVKPDTGHHHIIINGTSIEKGKVIPADANHLHFGKGQSEAELTLAPGKYSLTLQFADGMHLSYGKEWSNTINIEVK